MCPAATEIAARPAAPAWEIAGQDTVARAADPAEAAEAAVRRPVQPHAASLLQRTYPHPKHKARQGRRARRSP